MNTLPDTWVDLRAKADAVKGGETRLVHAYRDLGEALLAVSPQFESERQMLASDRITGLGLSRTSLQRAIKVAHTCADKLEDKVESGEVTSIRQAMAVIEGKAHVSHNGGENEWYTPQDIIEAARNTMGGIDLDPATSEMANQTVGAQMIFTEDDNGLQKHWPPCRIWMNPPYAQPLIAQFSTKLREAVENGAMAVVLLNNATETAWFQELMIVCSAICFPSSRVRFVAPDGRLSQPLQGQAILYFGTDPAKFTRAFADLGFTSELGEAATA